MGPANLLPEFKAVDELALAALGFLEATAQSGSLVKG